MAPIGKETRQLMVARAAGLIERGKSLVDQKNMQIILVWVSAPLIPQGSR
jgi:hypothetical protein